MIEFHLPGVTPAPQGSKVSWMPKDPRDKHLPKHRQRNHPTARPMMIESSSAALKTYRKALVVAARVAMTRHEQDMMMGAVKVEAIFVFPRPKYHYGTGANADVLKDSSPQFAFPLKRGDGDKLFRALNDALADAGVFVNDAQVVSHTCDIALVGNSEPADTIVRVTEL